jgi:hypothetical protein
MNKTARIIFNTSILIFVLLTSSRSIRAADWQPTSPEDLALKDNPKQPGADAMILYREVIDDASKAGVGGDTLEEYVRIKVFTQEGTKNGHIEIPFSKEYQSVNYVAGRTIKPDGTIVKFDGQVLETTAERSSGSRLFVKTFTLPDVQPGCIIEYKYSMQGQPGWVHSHEWTVSGALYTREAHFTYIPDTGYMNGLHPIYSTYLLPADAGLKEQPNGTYLMQVHDIPGIVDEPLMPPRRPIESRVEFFYQDLDAPAAETDSSDHYWNQYGKKWDGELEHFIDKKNALNQELSKIVSPGDSPEVKLRKIYARVQQIRNLSMEDFKMQKEVKAENIKDNSNVEDVLNRGYAYSRQIDYLFVGLARAVGFDATETYIAPRNDELFLPKRNEYWQLSDEIVWVHAGSQEYYLDPGARYFPFGLLPWYETETGGVRVDKHGATIVNTPESPSSDATIVRNADLEVKNDGSIAGTVQVDFTGQRAALTREGHRKDDETARTKYFGDEIRDWLPVGATFEVTKITNWEDTTQPVHVEGTLAIPSFAGSAARQMLMPFEIFQASQASEFAAEKRVNPVYIRYPYEEIDDIKLRAPVGYKAESLPPERKIDLGAVTYNISVTAQDSNVEVKRHLAVKGVIFSKDDYPTLRRFFGAVRANDNAQMVLQNAQSAKTN